MLCVELLIKCSKECRWGGAERSRLCVRKTAELMLCWWREAASPGVKERRQKLRALRLILLSQMGDAALSSAEWEDCNSWWLWHCWNGLAHPSLRSEKI